MSFDSYFLTFEWGSTLTLSNSKKLESHLYNTVICLEGRLSIRANRPKVGLKGQFFERWSIRTNRPKVGLKRQFFQRFIYKDNNYTGGADYKTLLLAIYKTSLFLEGGGPK